jgi:spermidine synthase
MSRKVLLFYIGFGSIISQILLIREFLISFYGNELSIGIIFASWLMWIGIGSALGNKVVRKSRNLSIIFTFLLALTPVLTLFQLLAVKFVRYFLHTPAGEFLSLFELVGYSFTVLSIGCFLWGMLFTIGARLLITDNTELWLGVNRAYVLESLGSVIGGLFFSFVLATNFTTLQIIILNVLIAWLIVFLQYVSLRITFAVVVSIFTVMFLILFTPLQNLEHWITAKQWSTINEKLTFVQSIDTKYQNLSLLQLENQYTIYADGRPAYSMPNTYDAELSAHSIMVHHLSAKRALVLGGGFNGVIKEILKYQIQEIDYVEIDPALLPFAQSVNDVQNQKALCDPRVNTMVEDGRDYLRRTNKSYDIILINVGEPSTASLNRFFTLEFFRQCHLRLAPNGIAAISFPSSAEYLASELLDLNASIYHTFKQVFANVLIIPGTHAVLIGSNSSSSLVSNPDSLARRFVSAGISTEFFSEYMFQELMLPERVAFATNTLNRVTSYRLNTDLNPVTYYFDLLLWNRLLKGDNSFFTRLNRVSIFLTGGIGILVLFLLPFVRYKNHERKEQYALTITMGCSGMVGMALNLLLLLNYQETFGSIYEMVGAMVAANMLGLALGALFVVYLIERYKLKKLLLIFLLVLIVFVLLLPTVSGLLLFIRSIPISLIVMTFSGSLIGMLFGIVNSGFLQHSSSVGSIYSSDVIGSSIGALMTCSVLLPVLGIQETVIFFALILFPPVVAVSLIRRTS